MPCGRERNIRSEFRSAVKEIFGGALATAHVQIVALPEFDSSRVKLMATLPTAEDAAEHILTVFIRSGATAGRVLPTRRVIQAFWKAPWSEADFCPGLDFAMQQGWIEQTGGYRLTEAGLPPPS